MPPRDIEPVGSGLYKMSQAETIEQKALLMEKMKTALRRPMVSDRTGATKELFKRVTQADVDKIAAEKPLNKVLEGDLAKIDQLGLKVGDAIELPYGSDLAKASLTTAGGLVTYDLRDPSLHLIPWLSPLRDMIPRVDKSAKAGIKANWKSIFASSIVQTAYQADPWINEGARAPLFTFSATDESANYTSMGIDGSVTYEAVSAAVGMEDANATARFFALESLMTREEDALLGGNNTLKLGTVGTVTVSAVTDAASALGTATYYVVCVALTYAGYRNSTVANGVATQKTITTPDGKVMTVNGGASIKSAVSSGQAITVATNHLRATVAAINGACAYAWFVGTAAPTSGLYLQQITTTNTMNLSTALVTTTQTANLLNTVDMSVNDGTTGGGQGQVSAYDGFIVQCLNAAGTFTAATGAYANTNAYAINLLGGTLTTTGAGGIAEIDAMLLYMWNTFRVSVTMLLVNAQQLKDITTKVLSNSSGPLLRYDLSGKGESYDLVASGTISFYFNPYLPGGGQKIPVMVHPTLPAGTIFAYSESLPPYFKTNSTPTVAEVLCRRDYYSRDWADVTREYQFGVYAETVLAVYAPFCLGLIQGIAAG